MKKNQNPKIERRVTTLPVELRNKEGESPKIVGHGAVFNQLSHDLGGFREQIAPGAFDDVLRDPDTRGLLNHDSSLLLGRNLKTMTLSVDDVGLRYEIEPGNTTVGRDTVEHLERGDIDQSSFGFTVDADHWDERDDGTLIRTITKVGRLFDVSPVTFPAYPQAAAAVRSLEIFNREHSTEFRIDASVQEPKNDEKTEQQLRSDLEAAQQRNQELEQRVKELETENGNILEAYEGMKKLI